MKVLLFVFITVIFCFTNILNSETMNYIEGIEIGCGFNSIEELVLDSPFEKIDSNTTAVKLKSISAISRVQSTLDLENILKIGQDNSFDPHFFDKNSNVSFLRNLKFNRYTLTYLIHINVKSYEKALLNPSMESEAENAFKHDSILFFEAFGDRFVQRIAFGGEFTGIIHISTNSEKDLKNTADEISKSGLDWKKLKNFETAIMKISKNHDVAVSHCTIGGDKELKIKTVKMLFATAKQFINQVKIIPVPVKLMLSDYSNFPGYNGKSIRNHINVIDTKRKLFRNYLEYTAMMKDVEFLLSNKKRFHWKTPSSPGHMRSRRNKLDEFLRKLRSKYEGIINEGKKPEKYVHLGVPEATIYGTVVLFPQEYDPAYKSVNLSYPKYSHYYEKPYYKIYKAKREFQNSTSDSKKMANDFWFSK